MTGKNSAKPEPAFEEALARLEKIVHSMESGELSLEKMMEGFEEGAGLVRLCTRRLNEVEKKIEKLVKRNGDVVAEPFTAGAGEADAEESDEPAEAD